jgi:hypothetical protein
MMRARRHAASGYKVQRGNPTTEPSSRRTPGTRRHQSNITANVPAKHWIPACAGMTAVVASSRRTLASGCANRFNSRCAAQSILSKQHQLFTENLILSGKYDINAIYQLMLKIHYLPNKNVITAIS